MNYQEVRTNSSDSLVEAPCSLAEALILKSDIELKQHKWIHSERGITLQESPDFESALALAVSSQTFRESKPCQNLLTFLEQDSDFSGAPEKLGYWGTPEALIQSFLSYSMRVHHGRVRIDSNIAKEVVTRFRVALNASGIAYEATARLLGVELSCPRVSITSNISLVRLTKEEINERQPDIKWSYLTVREPLGLLKHHTEIRFSVDTTVDKSVESAILNTQNAASSESHTIFENVLSAVRLFRKGSFELGPASTSSSIIKGFSSSRIYTLYVSPNTAMEIGASDAEKLQKAYRIVSESRLGDRVLRRALNRFLLGRQRHDVLDKIVDYVIAWESILLTNNEQSADSELSYRFRLNGSSILQACGVEPNPEIGLELMKGIYDVRSKIVHGGDDEQIQEALRKTNFESLSVLADDLEEKLSIVFFWLSELNVNDRPYKKRHGWEHLLWKSKTTSLAHHTD